MDREERVTFWGQKVKGQGRDGIQYAGNSTFSFHNSSERRHTILNDLALSYIHLVNYYYTVSQKNDTDVTHYRFNPHQPIWVIFGRDVAERVCY